MNKLKLINVDWNLLFVVQLFLESIEICINSVFIFKISKKLQENDWKMKPVKVFICDKLFLLQGNFGLKSLFWKITGGNAIRWL